jgi:pimeloyl-ACP methyl ester carboxylesterase
MEDAQAHLRKMEAHPKPLDRPLVILNGYLDPGIGGAFVASIIRRHIKDDRIITVAYPFAADFDQCRRKVLDEVQRAWPSEDPNETREIDVVGLSMGGLVGRYCGVQIPKHRRLKIKRLFTISSPHQGAVRAAALPRLLKLQIDMRPNSDFLQHLERTEEGDLAYELLAYVRLEDDVVGPQYAAPHGRTAWWVPNQPLQRAHIAAATDERILADVLRRLRAEKPFTRFPPARLPQPAIAE